MGKVSRYQHNKTVKIKHRAIELYKTGLSVRQVAFLIRKSKSWVHDAVNGKDICVHLPDNPDITTCPFCGFDLS